MLIERIWTGNAGRNFNYLVACPDTGEALAIDPLAAETCLARAQARGWRITQVFNTHEHEDHTGGNERVLAATGATLVAHADAVGVIPKVGRGLRGGDTLAVGRLRLACLDTPGHTRRHLCLLGPGPAPALFCGDTLFNAGVGNCVHGGDPALLYETFAGPIAGLGDDVRVYPGHEYLLRNLAFTAAREPGNAAARALAGRCEALAADAMPVFTLGEERAVNTFLRLDSGEIRTRLEADTGARPADARATFLALRALRNRW